ncbi:MAG TPA: glycosyltransferase family 39 protein [Pyrinomonadaceae bacterium]|nr:glycosyltransferase family 39 protein [Pyrinomonadaceae bacterium]
MEDALQNREAERAIGALVANFFAAIERVIATRKAELICAGLLFLMAINLFAQISRKSISNDEVVHIPAGYYHLVAGKFQLNNEHPPLVKMWAALPLLFIQPEESAIGNSQDVTGNFSEETWKYLEQFWPSNRAHFESISFWCRAMMVPIAVGLGLLIFVYCRQLFGDRAAVFAVAFYSLEPTVLAHGRIVHTDLPAAFAYLLFFFVLRHYLLNRTARRALLLGLTGGLALCVKFSMIVLLPVLACLAIIGFVFAKRLEMNRKRLLSHAGIVACALLLVINAAYYFRRPPIEAADVKWVQTMSPGDVDRWLTFFRAGSTIVPTYWLFGQYNVKLHNRDGHPTSLLGQYSRTGWWYYFPTAFALKTSLPFLLISIAGLAWALWAIWHKDWRFLWVLAPLAIYVALSMSSRINIGVRHFLPAFPFLFIAAGVVTDRMLRANYARHLVIAVVVLTIGWSAVEMLRAYPDYVPYMNQLASGHPRWWYLSDSNVEWGDDVKDLANYLHARGETDVDGALSGGWATLRLYDINYHEIFPKPGRVIPDTRYVAIGGSFLNGSTIAVAPDESGKMLSEEQRINYLAGFRTRQPEAVFGNSIYLYRVRD